MKELDEISRNGPSSAIYLLDLNDFKRVNDEYGHGNGDQVLRVIAQRFRAAARMGDVVARGDEFGVISKGVASVEEAAEVGRRFISALDDGIAAQGAVHRVGVSVGVAFGPEHGGTPDAVLDAADMAMFAAKRGGSSRIAFAGERNRDQLSA